MGPIPLRGGGTITAEQRNTIWYHTGVSASVRYRQQWQARCLSLAGPAEKLSEAKRMADEYIRANGTEGGRAPDPSEVQQEVNRMATTQTTMWASMQAMADRMTMLEAQVLEAQQAAAAAYAAGAAAQSMAQKVQNQRKRRKRAAAAKEKESSDEGSTGKAAQAKASKSVAAKDPVEPPAEPEPSSSKGKLAKPPTPSSSSAETPKAVKEETRDEVPKLKVKEELHDEEAKPPVHEEEPPEKKQICSPTSDANKTDLAEAESDSEDSPTRSEAPTIIPEEEKVNIPEALPMTSFTEDKPVDHE